MADEHGAVVARFRCEKVVTHPPHPSAIYKGREVDVTHPRDIELSAVSAPNEPESSDYSFWKATPSGKLEMRIDNPEAGEFFEAGAKYEILFRRVPDED